jgi:nucleoid-associated protein YgaU
MGKDYKIGLICGLVAAVAALIWLATRPSLNRRVWTPGPATASAEKKPQAAPKPANPIDRSNQASSARPQTAGTPEPQRTEPQRTEPTRTSESVPVVSRQANTPAPPPVRTHIVQDRETLSSIAQQYYGNPNAWQRIYNANTKVIKNPNVVPPGTKLTIP